MTLSVVLFLESVAGRSKTLRKPRSKAIALFQLYQGKLSHWFENIVHVHDSIMLFVLLSRLFQKAS